MTKIKRYFLRFLAVILCVVNIFLGTSSSTIVSAAIEESVPISDEEIARALSNAKFIDSSEDSSFILQTSNVEISDDYYPDTADPYNEDIYYNGVPYIIEEGDISTTGIDLPGDDQVYMVQKWLNQEYGDVTGFGSVPENGKTAWPTIYGLIRALQHELGITSLADSFGPTTQAKYKDNILSRQDGVEKNMYAILQGALWCKGYSPGYNFEYNSITKEVSVDAVFDEKVEAAVIEFKKDAGLINPDGIVTLNTMKALMSMDAFKLLGSSYGAKAEVRIMQQKLNREYEAYIGLMPCDGVYGRNTNKAVVYSLQALEGMPVGTATGSFGNLTKQCCPEIPYKRNSSAAQNYSGDYYSEEQIKKFTELLQFALYVNGFGDGDFDGVFDSQTQKDLRDFQKKHRINESGKADIGTWMSLFVSYGDKSRAAFACDCATILTEPTIKTLVANGYKYVGRYLTGTYNGGISKALTREEAELIINSGMNFFPIYQTSAREEAYFTPEKGIEDANSAIEAASKLGVPRGTIIYFAVDFDAMDYQITNSIIPYFEKVYSVVSQSDYKVGIYGARNVCSRVSDKGYACASFVSDMSSGFSGNLGFTIPDNWAFDQFATVSIGEGNGKIEIDKDAISGKDLGVSKLDDVFDKNISFASTNVDNDTLHGPIINIMGKEVELFSFNLDFSLPLDKLIVESEFDEISKELNVIIGVDIYEYSHQRYGVREKPTGEKYNQAFVEVKKMVSTIKNPYSGINNPEFKSRFKDIKGCLYDRGFKFGISTNGYAVGYMTISFKGDKPVLKSGELGILASAAASWHYPVPAVPTLTLRFAIQGSVEGGFGCILNEESNEYFWGGHMGFTFKPSLSAGLNAYIASAYAGVGGELDFNFRLPFDSFANSFTANFSAEVFIEYTALNWHGREAFTFLDEPLYPKENIQKSLIIQEENFELIQPTSASLSEFDVSNTFKTNMQVYAKPQIINIGNDQMFMVYIDSATERLDENATILMYSVYDGSVWSAPLPISDDGTADFEPKICADSNGGVHILWQNSKIVLEEGAALDETATSIDLSYTYWDGENFSNVVSITSDNQDYEMSHKIVSSGNSISVVWQQNSDNDVFGLTGTNSIYRRQCLNGTWQNIETLASELSVITNIDTSYINDENAIVYTAKSSTDESTINDVEVFLVTENSVYQLTNDSFYDYSAKFCGDELYWGAKNSIFCIKNGNISTKTTVIDNISGDIKDFKVVNNESGDKSIIWQYEDDKGMIFYASDYNIDTDSFGDFLPIEKVDGVVRGWDACLMSNGQIELAYCYANYLNEPDDNGLPYGVLSLIQKPVSEICDISVEPITIYSEDYATDSGTCLISDVFNNGSQTVNSFRVSITDADGNTLEPVIIEQALAAGESDELRIPFVLPSKTTREDYSISILPADYQDVNLSDNNTVFSVGFADLAIQSLTETRTETGRKLDVIVMNEGYETVNFASVNLLYEGINGELIDTKSVSTLEPGMSTEITFDIDESALDSSLSTDAILYYIYIETDLYEADYANNDKSIALYPDYSVSLITQIGGTVSGSGIYENNSIVTITATPNPGYLFEGWYENDELLVGLPSTIELTVNRSRTLEARFVKSDLTISSILVNGVKRTGNTLDFIVQTEGITKPYLWSLYIYNNDEICFSVEDSVMSDFSHHFTNEGTYKLVASVADETGHEITCEQELIIRNYSVRSDSTISFANKIPAGVKIVHWQSDNEEIATVDENGIVTGHKLGETKIRAYAENGARYSWVVETELNWWQAILISLAIGVFFLPFWVAE